MCYDKVKTPVPTLNVLHDLPQAEQFLLAASHAEHPIHPPINFLIIPADALPMLNLPLLRMFMATWGETDGVQAAFSLGHAGHCFLLQCSLDFTPHWETLPVLGSALTSATTALSIPRKMLQNWAFPATHYTQCYIWSRWSSDLEIIPILITWR